MKQTAAYPGCTKHDKQKATTLFDSECRHLRQVTMTQIALSCNFCERNTNDYPRSVQPPW